MKKSPYLISGVLLLLISIGASGCGSSTSSTAQSTASTTSGQTATGQTNQQSSQAQRGEMASNPALREAMEIRRLQGNTQLALTSDQKTKLKPILQGLISTTNPSQDYLKQQADAMNALLTDQQKSYLTQPRTNQTRNNNTSNSNGNNSGQNNNQNGESQNKASSNKSQNGNQKRSSLQPQDIYQQLLNSLN